MLANASDVALLVTAISGATVAVLTAVGAFILILRQSRKVEEIKTVTHHTNLLAKGIDAAVNGVPPGTRTIREGIDRLVEDSDASRASEVAERAKNPGPGIKQLVEELLEKVKEGNINGGG